MHSFKSADFDEIFPALLKKGEEILIERLGSIFKSPIAFGHISSFWEKTKVVLFRRTKVSESELGELELFGTTLTLRVTVKYLGVIFDNRLTWIPHLEHKVD